MVEKKNNQAGEPYPNPFLTNYSTFYKSLKLSEPQFSHPQNGNISKVIPVLLIFVYVFNKYLLNIYYMPIQLGARARMMNMTVCAIRGLDFRQWITGSYKLRVAWDSKEHWPAELVPSANK